MSHRLNIFDARTGEYITCIRGDDMKEILDRAVAFYGAKRWEWDGKNRPPRKD